MGAERRTNPALAPMTREEFVRRSTEGLPEVPRYFPMDVVARNRPDPAERDNSMIRGNLASGRPSRGADRTGRIGDSSAEARNA